MPKAIRQAVLRRPQRRRYVVNSRPIYFPPKFRQPYPSYPYQGRVASFQLPQGYASAAMLEEQLEKAHTLERLNAGILTDKQALLKKLGMLDYIRKAKSLKGTIKDYLVENDWEGGLPTDIPADIVNEVNTTRRNQGKAPYQPVTEKGSTIEEMYKGLLGGNGQIFRRPFIYECIHSVTAPEVVREMHGGSAAADVEKQESEADKREEKYSERYKSIYGREPTRAQVRQNMPRTVEPLKVVALTGHTEDGAPVHEVIQTFY